MVTVSYGHYGQHTTRIRPDRICLIRLPASIRFHSSKEGPDHIVQNRARQFLYTSFLPDRIHLAQTWPGHLDRFWAKCIRSGRKLVYKNCLARFWQNATGPLRVSHFQTRLRSSTDSPDHTVENHPGSDLVLADCVRFGQTDPVRCGRTIKPTSGHRFRAVLDRMRIKSGMLSGKVLRKYNFLFHLSSTALL